MKYAALIAIAACGVAPQAWAAKRYPVTGLVLKVDRANRTFVASCSAIPGYMEAMVMPITVRRDDALNGVERSRSVDFTLVVESDDSYAENIRVHDYASLETEPLAVRRLQLLSKAGDANGAVPVPALGQKIGDFTLTDQKGRRVSLSQFAGKAVAITFIYTSCPLPNYCFRLSNNFGVLQKRFAERMGKDVVLISITFDPAHDRPEVLDKYATTWKADPESWRFLTGSLPEVKEVCRRFGVNYWPDEGTLTHSLHTVVIDREGKLAANFEGNEFTAKQLGDFVAATLR